jgi:hypothetical protein
VRRSETTFLHVEKNMQGLCEDAYLRYNLITRAHMCSAGDMPNSEQFGG